MKITCPECATSYMVKASLIGEEGRSVKCARCGTKWTARAEQDTTSIETEMPAAAEAEAARSPEMAAAGAAGGAETVAFDNDGDMDWSETLPASAQDADEADAMSGTAEGLGEGSGEGSGEDGADEDDDFSRFMDDADGLGGGDGGMMAATGEDDADAEAPIDIESLARRPKIQVKPREEEPVLTRVGRSAMQRARQVRPRRVVGAGLFALALGLMALAIVLRTPIVARMPDLAGLYAMAGFEVNLRGLEFRDLRTFRELEDGTIVLVIEGTVANISGEPVYVPAVRFALRSEDAQEIYAWIVEPRARRLDTGTTTRIRTRLASPPNLAADILVRFVERGREKQASLK